MSSTLCTNEIHRRYIHDWKGRRIKEILSVPKALISSPSPNTKGKVTTMGETKTKKSTTTEQRQGAKNMIVMTVSSNPKIQDPREFNTILISSIRALYGDMEHYTYELSIERKPPSDFVVDDDDDDGTFLLSCPVESEPSIRAALCMVTTPPFLSSTIYRFDVLEVAQKRD